MLNICVTEKLNNHKRPLLLTQLVLSVGDAEWRAAVLPRTLRVRLDPHLVLHGADVMVVVLLRSEWQVAVRTQEMTGLHLNGNL